jgi:rRNA maturation protein Nop10
MPMPTVPMKTTCQSCGWSKVVPQQGEVLFTLKQCERCGSENLTLAPARILDRLNPVTYLRGVLGK